MRILVTGGAGFIGSVFTRHLLADAFPGLEGAEVTVLDKLTYAGNLANLAEVEDSDRYDFVQGDICDPELTSKLVGRADAVVHFAAESHVDRSILGGADFVLTNVLGTQTLLQAALDTKLHQVRARLHRRGVRLDRRRFVGREAAVGAELAVLGVQGVIGSDRPGLRQDPRRAGRDHPVLEQLRPVPVPGEGHPAVRHQPDGRRDRAAVRRGSQVRDWLHVDDHCRGIALVLAGGRTGEVYNIGGGTELTNAELTAKLIEATGRDESFIERIIDPRGGGHDQRYSVDHSKISDELGYQPQVPVRPGPGRHRHLVPGEPGLVGAAEGPLRHRSLSRAERGFSESGESIPAASSVFRRSGARQVLK